MTVSVGFAIYHLRAALEGHVELSLVVRVVRVQEEPESNLLLLVQNCRWCLPPQHSMIQPSNAQSWCFSEDDVTGEEGVIPATRQQETHVTLDQRS
ncbi:hypothetical protein AALO_G00210060 [Alosa alosa]|uniref:Uncharacterized protein n=1 Tax=Alosa alosa TaxID=278164 RepID=A0AAV6G076_9TELE|nr:hypothetical protein AALO_G00210060 [Alosa alosa]